MNKKTKKIAHPTPHIQAQDLSKINSRMTQHIEPQLLSLTKPFECPICCETYTIYEKLMLFKLNSESSIDSSFRDKALVFPDYQFCIDCIETSLKEHKKFQFAEYQIFPKTHHLIIPKDCASDPTFSVVKLDETELSRYIESGLDSLFSLNYAYRGIILKKQLELLESKLELAKKKDKKQQIKKRLRELVHFIICNTYNLIRNPDNSTCQELDTKCIVKHITLNIKLFESILTQDLEQQVIHHLKQATLPGTRYIQSLHILLDYKTTHPKIYPDMLEHFLKHIEQRTFPIEFNSADYNHVDNDIKTGLSLLQLPLCPHEYIKSKKLLEFPLEVIPLSLALASGVHKDERCYINAHLGFRSLAQQSALVGNTQLLNLLHEHNISLDDNASVSPLYLATESGHKETTQFLCKHSQNLNTPAVFPDDQLYPLHRATDNNHIEIVKILMRHHPNLTVTDRTGRSPVFMAAQNGHTEIVKILAQHGAKLEQKAVHGMTPLFIACQQGHSDVVTILTRYGVNVNESRDDNVTPAFVAASQGHANVLKILIDHHVDIHQQYGPSSLSLVASQEGHLNVLKLLHSEGLDLSLEGSEGCTPYNMAICHGHVNCADYIQSVTAHSDPHQAKRNA